LEELDLRDIVHHELEALPRGLLELLGAEHALEEHDRLSNAAGAQRHPFLEARYAESVGGLPRERRREQPMPVGVGLDHRHDARSEERRVGKECRSRWWPSQ